MFLKKVFFCKNVLVSCRKIEFLCKACRPAQRIFFKALSCESVSPEMEVEMSFKAKKGSKTTAYKVMSIPNSQAQLGEAPHWNRINDSLYYVDLNAGKLLRYDFQSKEVKKSKIYGVDSATFVIPVDGEENKFVVGSNRNIELVIWDGNSHKSCVKSTLYSVQNDEKFSGNRFNDGKCDEMGRLFAGTMCAAGNEFETRLGELYRFDGKEIKTLLGDLGISNGLTWNKEGNKFYFIDMADYNVKEFVFDKKTGNISKPKTVYDWSQIGAPQHLMLPDGMTIDTDGNIYVAVFNAGTVYKIDPCSCRILLEIKLPCRQVTSCAFGGPSMDILYVTTAAKFDEPPPAGMLFAVTGLGAQGFPMNLFKMKDDKCSHI